MKKIKTLIGLLFTTIALTAQSYKTKSIEVVNYHPQKTWSAHLTQSIFRELRFGYEHTLNNSYSLSYNLGCRFQKPNANPEVPSGAGWNYLTISKHFNKHYNGIYTSIMPKYRIVNKGYMFFGLELYNQYLWFNNRKVSYNNIESSKESFEALRSEKVNITGLKLMFESLILGEGRINNKFGIYPSFVSGIGFLYQTYKFESSNGTWRGQPIVVVKKESGHLFLPSFHLGIKLNFYVNYK